MTHTSRVASLEVRNNFGFMLFNALKYQTTLNTPDQGGTSENTPFAEQSRKMGQWSQHGCF